MNYEHHNRLAAEFTSKALATSVASKKREFMDKARFHRAEAERLRKPPEAGATVLR